MHLSNLLLLGINSVKKFMELDYMEYATDAAARAAYASSEGDVIDATLGSAYYDDYELVRNNSTRNKVAMSFVTTASGSLVRVRIYLIKIGSPTGNIWCELFAASSQIPTGSVLATSASKDVSTLSGTIGWVEFTFATPYQVTAGSAYAIAVAGDWAYSATACVAFGIDFAGATYTNGQMCEFNESTWSSSYGADSEGIFETYLLVLQCYSESTIKQQGSYSLKGVATITAALNDTLIRTLGTSTIDLTGKNLIRFGMYASRTGSNIKLGFRDIDYPIITTGTVTCGTVEVTGLWTNCTTTQVNIDDGNRTSKAGPTYSSFQLSDFNFAIPTNATIVGIEVGVNCSISTSDSTGHIKCALSWDDGSTWTDDSAEQTTSDTLDSTKTFGSSTTLWGRIWAVSDFAVGSFRLKVYGYVDSSLRLIRVDYIYVKIYYNTFSTMEHTPTISTINAWQTINWDISAIPDGNKDFIDQIIFTIVNADAANTFYIDGLRAR